MSEPLLLRLRANIVTDSEIRQIANQLAATNRQMIIDEIDRRFRMPTGVQSGGPFNTFSVNDQGQIIAASVSSVSSGGTASFYRATNQSFTSGAFAQMIFTGTQWVDASLYSLNTGTGVVTFSTTGHYLIIARIQWASNATGRRIIEVNQHGSSTPLIANDIQAAITGSTTPVTAMGFANIIAGDTVDVNGYQNSGGNLNASSGLGYGAFHIQQIG
jgi:hypothetical protein